jgi:hypothetical protein
MSFPTIPVFEEFILEDTLTHYNRKAALSIQE